MVDNGSLVTKLCFMMIHVQLTVIFSYVCTYGELCETMYMVNSCKISPVLVKL